VFRGTFQYKIDGKGRLPIPAPFRRVLEEAGQATVVVTHLDQCLAVYAASEWMGLEQQLLLLPQFKKDSKALIRRLASQATDCAFDTQGRILIPSILRRAAALEKEVTVVGVLNRFEVWSPANWATFLRESEQALDDVVLPASTAKP
jgi:MraZ protein